MFQINVLGGLRFKKKFYPAGSNDLFVSKEELELLQKEVPGKISVTEKQEEESEHNATEKTGKKGK